MGLTNVEMGFSEESISNRTKHKDEKLEKLEVDLVTARALIREATKNVNRTSYLEDADYVPQGEIYRNAYAFHWSHLLMERMFKIFVYEEGKPPIFHNGPCKSILHGRNGPWLYGNWHQFRTWDPDEAHVYFLPFSVAIIIKYYAIRLVVRKPVFNALLWTMYALFLTSTVAGIESLGADHFILL